VRLEVLGCSGGIGGSLRTTALLVDDDVLIDAGTGVGDLSLSAMAKLDHIFVTHSHLDHVACIPLLLDSVGCLRNEALTVYGCAETIETLRRHIFNWKIWPDFAVIPDAEKPYLRYRVLETGESVRLEERTFTPIPANHVIPAVGYHLDSGSASLVFSGDTTCNDALWEYLKGVVNLRHLIIETAFPDEEQDLAVASKHLCPALLSDQLKRLPRPAEILVTHLKPGAADLTMREIQERAGQFGPRMLLHGEVIYF